MSDLMVEMRSICKTFPGGVVANKDANLSIRPGEIHAVVGENGAGKSTLMKILYGLYQPDAGSISVRGRAVTIDNPRVAKQLGVGMVHQHFMLVPSFTVLQNIILGYEPRRGGLFVDRKRAAREVAALCERYHLQVPYASPVADIPVGLQQRVEIIKAIYRGAELLILDEPTAVLTPQEVNELFAICRGMAQQGKTIVFISHKLREVLSLSDRITVMRAGETLETVDSSETDEEELARLIVGRDHIWSVPASRQATPGATRLSVENLSVLSRRNTWAVERLSLEVKAGEIVGLAGVEGNGQSELIAALAGLQPVAKGCIRLDGRDITRESVARRRELGMRHIPEDRMQVGASLQASLTENLLIDPTDRASFGKGGLIQWPRAKQYASSRIDEFKIVAPGPDARAGDLSGGNLQKLVAARELASGQRCLLVTHPTRGLDIGAAEFIYQRLFEARKAGCAVLLVSADLDEIQLLSDRILVLYEGQIVAELSSAEAEPEKIGLYMTGAQRQLVRGEA